MAVWAILAAPLLISADLATMRPEFKEIILNKQVIEVDQDPLGIAGILLFKVSYGIIHNKQKVSIKFKKNKQ